MKTRFLKVAQQELDAGVQYYNAERPGLGYEFLWEVFAALDRVILLPEAWPPIGNGARRCLVRRFPYGLIYRQVDDTLVILAVANLHRGPDISLQCSE